MKRIYESPSVEVVKLGIEDSLLTLSIAKNPSKPITSSSSYGEVDFASKKQGYWDPAAWSENASDEEE